MHFSEDFVRPLKSAENNFLQVLLTQFSLTKSNGGFELTLGFDDNTPAIWTRHAKGHVRGEMLNFEQKRLRYQDQIESRLLRGDTTPLEFNDPGFPFRYASGGVLPILRMGDKEYFSFFYRDIEPVGWNIANGGSDSRAELLDPMAIVEREFREELIMLKKQEEGKPDSGRRYVFSWQASNLSDHVEHAMARALWTRAFPNLDVENYEQLTLPVEWLYGPDVVNVRMGTNQPKRVRGCFLNINAMDFGIELDTVARLYVDEDVVLLDGEIMDQKILGRPVGLFGVDRMLSEFRNGARRFIPELFFYNGRRQDGNAFEELIQGEFLDSLPDVRTDAEIRDFQDLPLQYDLCPVTRSILTRYASVHEQHVESPPAPAPDRERAVKRPPRFEVFISCGAGDEPLACRVYDYLTQEKNKRAFFYQKYAASRWGRQIGDALKSAECLVLVGSDHRRIARGWPETEWFAFMNAVNTGRKRSTAKMISFLPGVDPRKIHPIINTRVIINTRNLDEGLKKLGELMEAP